MRLKPDGSLRWTAEERKRQSERAPRDLSKVREHIERQKYSFDRLALAFRFIPIS